MAVMCRGVVQQGTLPAWEAALTGGDVSRGAMARRGAVTCGRGTSQAGGTALVRAASRGHKDTVELLLDRGADLQAKDRVSAAAVCCFATDRAGCHGRVRGCGDDGDALGRQQGSDGATRCGDAMACDIAVW